MIKSMTGYGRGESQHLGTNYVVEVRSVNHRFCDVSVQLAKWLKPLELMARRRIQEKFERGRFDASVFSMGRDQFSEKELKVDHDLARAYMNLLQSMKRELRLPGKIELNTILQLRDVLKVEEREEDPQAAWPGVSEALDSALESLQSMREAEGKALYSELTARLNSVQSLGEEIKSRQPEVTKEYRQRLRDRVNQLLGGEAIDAQRLEQEVVLMAEKSDISEEVSRLAIHITEFRKLLESGDAVGRKLDFLLQEMNREVNTAASKALDVAVSHAAVNIKSELEKIKQQAQNIE